jgi:hypothetical protein
MPLPISRTQLDLLGKRLAAADVVSDEDYSLLQSVLVVYDEALAYVLSRLEGLGFAATGRLKTTGTLIDKLRREHGMGLKGVHDVAGARIVVNGSRLDQDDVAESIMQAFRGGSRPPVPVDRRARPSSGYRAMHVVVFHDGLPVEVQIRTELQDLWAQAFERLGDRWGRAIRYGGLPEDPGRAAIDGHPEITRELVVSYMQRLGEQIDRTETVRANVLRAKTGLEIASDPDADEYRALLGDLEESKDELAALEEGLRGTLRLLVQYATQEA